MPTNSIENSFGRLQGSGHYPSLPSLRPSFLQCRVSCFRGYNPRLIPYTDLPRWCFSAFSPSRSGVFPPVGTECYVCTWGLWRGFLWCGGGPFTTFTSNSKDNCLGG